MGQPIGSAGGNRTPDTRIMTSASAEADAQEISQILGKQRAQDAQTARTDAERPDTETGTGGWVYFVLDYTGTAIKIGFSRQPLSRLFHLQSALPYPMRPLGSCPGGYPFERKLHGEFAADRLMGEWFARTPALEERIKYLCDDWVDCRRERKKIERAYRQWFKRLSPAIHESSPPMLGDGLQEGTPQ